MNDNATPSPAQSGGNAGTAQEQWRGLTLDELRTKRAIALVRREVGRERIDHVVAGVRTNVSNNGVRGLLFDSKTVSGLKTADYVLLGWRLTRTLSRLWRKMR